MFMPAREPEPQVEPEVQVVPPELEMLPAEQIIAESSTAPNLSTPNVQNNATLIAMKRRGSRSTPPPKRPRKLAVKVSQADYERLGLAAVKKDMTRSDIVRQAIDSYLERLSREYRNECLCISPSEACCRGDS